MTKIDQSEIHYIILRVVLGLLLNLLLELFGRGNQLLILLLQISLLLLNIVELLRELSDFLFQTLLLKLVYLLYLVVFDLRIQQTAFELSLLILIFY